MVSDSAGLLNTSSDFGPNLTGPLPTPEQPHPAPTAPHPPLQPPDFPHSPSPLRPPGTFISERLPRRPAEVSPGVRGRGPGLSGAHLGVRLRGRGHALLGYSTSKSGLILSSLAHAMAGCASGSHCAGGAVVTTRAPPSSQTDETANSGLGHAPPHGGCRRGRRAAGDMKTSAREFGMELGQIGTCGSSLPHF